MSGEMTAEFTESLERAKERQEREPSDRQKEKENLNRN